MRNKVLGLLVYEYSINSLLLFSGHKLEVMRKHRGTFCPNPDDNLKNYGKRHVYTSYTFFFSNKRTR